MARYKVTSHYNTRGPDGQVLGWTRGTVVDLDDATAEWVERDCVGLLVPVVEVAETVEPETPAEVPNDVPDASALAADEAADDEDEKPVADAQPDRQDRSHRVGRRRH